MSIQRIGAGPRMAKAVVHGDTVYLAGQVAANAAGKSVGEQTAASMRWFTTARACGICGGTTPRCSGKA